MKRIETQFQDQSRWNESVGKANLRLIGEQPEKFLVDPSKFEQRKRDMLAALGEVRNKRILEFGSGRGELSIALASQHADVIGIELGEDLVELARRIAEVNSVECSFVRGCIDALPFENESFDFVVGHAILHHLPVRGVRDSIAEAHRVLKPGGKALFVECVENSRTFDFVQNLIPVGKPGTSMYRPSMLQRKKWKQFLATADDRAMSNAELIAAGEMFSKVEFKYYGLLARLKRIVPGKPMHRVFDSLDQALTHQRSPIKKYSQSVLVTYHS